MQQGMKTATEKMSLPNIHFIMFVDFFLNLNLKCIVHEEDVVINL